MYACNTKNFWKSFFLRFRNFINSTYTFSKLDIKVFKKWFILLKKNKNTAFSNLSEIEYILIICITLIKYKTQSGFTLKNHLSTTFPVVTSLSIAANPKSTTRIQLPDFSFMISVWFHAWKVCIHVGQVWTRCTQWPH